MIANLANIMVEYGVAPQTARLLADRAMTAANAGQSEYVAVNALANEMRVDLPRPVVDLLKAAEPVAPPPADSVVEEMLSRDYARPTLLPHTDPDYVDPVLGFMESALGSGAPVRAHNPDGTFKADDPTTPDVNEAYVHQDP